MQKCRRRAPTPTLLPINPPPPLVQASDAAGGGGGGSLPPSLVLLPPAGPAAYAALTLGDLFEAQVRGRKEMIT